jgi:hypothetical protein
LELRQTKHIFPRRTFFSPPLRGILYIFAVELAGNKFPTRKGTEPLDIKVHFVGAVRGDAKTTLARVRSAQPVIESFRIFTEIHKLSRGFAYAAHFLRCIHP